VCRCGQPRPEPGPTLAGAADLFEKAPPIEPEKQDWSWVPKALGVLLVVGLYFGSRQWGRYSASKEAKNAAIQALSKVGDAASVRELVERHHEGCFDQHYKTDWRPRRARSTFDAEKYAECVLKRIVDDTGSLSRAAAREAPRAASRPQPAAALPPATTVPTPPPQPRSALGRVTLGDLKVVEFRREPQMVMNVRFVALGNEVVRDAFCSFRIDCAGGQEHLVSCPLDVAGIKGSGSLQYAAAGPAPAQAACRLELTLSDGRSPKSNTASVALQ
jgi:hypothetical protein